MTCNPYTHTCNSIVVVADMNINMCLQPVDRLFSVSHENTSMEKLAEMMSGQREIDRYRYFVLVG